MNQTPYADATPDRQLRGGHALVTGAGSGIGRAVARALAGAGMRLWLVGRRADALRAALPESPDAQIVAADLSTASGLATAIDACPASLDVLVHCAGTFLPGGPAGIETKERERMDALNMEAPLALTRRCLPALRVASGQVVVVNSSAGLRPPGPGNTAYAAGKQRLRAATDALRQEINPHGIRVLSVFPGRTDTPMQTTVLAAEGRTAPTDCLLQPEDVAAMILAALALPTRAEVTDIMIRPARAL